MKDYYLLLGVNNKADKSEIKKAYRDSVKKYHPDGREATRDTNHFREITEAYETLSDNNKRKKYDEKLIDDMPVDSTGSVEPLRSNVSQYQRGYDPNPFIRDCTEDLSFRFFKRVGLSQKSLCCDIYLTHEEVQNDIQYPYTINIVKPCPHCNSSFSEFMLYCPYCNGSQYIRRKKELIINVPKGIKSGSRVQLDLDHVGLNKVRLMVTVFVSSNWRE